MVRDLRNIMRVDAGWWVRITRGTRGYDQVVHSHCFADVKHGGSRAALAAARAWRNAKLVRLPQPKTGGKGSVRPGFGYVRRARVMRRVMVAPVWVAVIRLETRWSSTSRSIELWGSGEARLQCEEWLAKRRGELRRRAKHEGT